MDPLAAEPRRPRPVAGLPSLDGRAVAKAWLLELVADRPLEDAASLPAAELAREGPGLATAVIRALADDDALGRLAPGGDLAGRAARIGPLAGAADPAGVVRAAEALRRAVGRVLYAAARLEHRTAAEAGDRLAHVCALIAAAGVAADLAAEPAPEADDPIAATTGWRTVVQRQVARHARDGRPFALLAVEADGVERLRSAQLGDEVDRELERLERTLAAALRPADQLLAEDQGRYWVTAPDTGPELARELAGRLADAAGRAAHHDVPLTVSVGVATCPEDGEDAEALVARADAAMFAARSAGVPVA